MRFSLQKESRNMPTVVTEENFDAVMREAHQVAVPFSLLADKLTAGGMTIPGVIAGLMFAALNLSKFTPAQSAEERKQLFLDLAGACFDKHNDMTVAKH
jgi:hypothetical protein